MTAVSPYAPTTFYYDNGVFLCIEWITQVADMDNPPLVFSISYGFPEYLFILSEKIYHYPFLSSFDLEAMKLGLMGVTIIAASGDNG